MDQESVNKKEMIRNWGEYIKEKPHNWMDGWSVAFWVARKVQDNKISEFMSRDTTHRVCLSAFKKCPSMFH